jgi:hypothetical protein
MYIFQFLKHRKSNYMLTQRRRRLKRIDFVVYLRCKINE